MCIIPKQLAALLTLAAWVALNGNCGDLPKPDGKSADVSKPVKVFILLGQSNMLGAGKIKGLQKSVEEKKLYPFLIDSDGKWTVRKDVRNVFVMSDKMSIKMNDWLSVKGRSIGPEVGIGHHLGNAMEEPVMLLKACIGNRGLNWDLCPPGAERWEHDGNVYAGYKDTYPMWKKGGEPRPGKWYAGKQWDTDIGNAKKVLADIGKFYPGATKYEVAGFFFWQGAKDLDKRFPAWPDHYEEALVFFIKALRKEFKVPHAKFVVATMGQGIKGDNKSSTGKITAAQLAVDGKAGKYPEFKGNVATVYTHPVSKGGSANGHYNGNAETYMNVGLEMGKAMVELLSKK